jgi:hypothetical protein
MKRTVKVEVGSRRVGGESHVSHGVAEALGAAADCGAEVVHKERDKEKGKSPHTPLKEKETEKETFPEPVPEHHARAGARTREGAFRSGSGAVDIRQRISGAGSANRVRIDRVSTSKGGNDRNAILKRARIRIRRHAPEALETFNLIVRNGSNRMESIRTLAKSRDATKLDSAKRRYWHNMKKLENIFSTP